MANMSLQSRRISWIDIAKAITMVLVVFGHVMRQGYGQKIVYSFHVPAFFMLSGITCRFPSGIKNRIQRDAKTILVPYYIWGLVSIAAYALLGRVAMGAMELDRDTSVWKGLLGLLYASPRTMLMKYNIPLWFLPGLFVTRLLFYGLHTMFRGKKGWILLGSGGIALCGFGYTWLHLSPLPFSLEICCKLLPFFTLGFLLGNSPMPAKLQALPRPTRYASAAGVLLLTAIMAVVFPKVNYTSDTFPSLPAFYACALWGCVGIGLLSMAVGKATWLEFVGQQTMGILVMHKFPVILFQILPPFKALLKNPDSVSGILGGMGVSALTVSLCLLAAFIIARFFPFLLGKSKRN